jgi:ankyrin repeat protein
MFKAIGDGWAPGQIDRLLSAKPNLMYEMDVEGNTPMHFAVILGAVETVAVLVKHSAHWISVTNFARKTPLLMAASRGSLEMVRVMVEADSAAINVNDGTYTPLTSAMEAYNDYLAEGHTPVDPVFTENMRDVVTILLGHATSEDAFYGGLGLPRAGLKEFMMGQVLDTAILFGHSELASLVIDKFPSAARHCHVVQATWPGSLPILTKLLNSDPSLATRVNENLETPLHVVLSDHHNEPATRTEAVEMLLQAAPQVAYAARYDGWTPLHIAALRGDTDSVALLLHHAPAAAMIVDDDNRPPIRNAVISKNPDVVRLLMKCAPDTAAYKCIQHGYNALHIACGMFTVSTPVVEALLRCVRQNRAVRGRTGLWVAEQGCARQKVRGRAVGGCVSHSASLTQHRFWMTTRATALQHAQGAGLRHRQL